MTNLPITVLLLIFHSVALAQPSVNIRSEVDAVAKNIATCRLEIDSMTALLFAIVESEKLRKPDRLYALGTLAATQTFLADSLLIANIEHFNFISEHPDGAGDEFDWMFPCFAVLSKKCSGNFNLVKPIMSNLHSPQTETALFLIKQLLVAIFSNEEILHIWLDTQIANSGNQIFIQNLTLLKKTG
ncbi:MAG: hypothetical protein H6569_03585 [Lewinellaceae bacterium]|nr:hypothetical protein [Lewinellaceae bacterium]